MSSNRSWLSRPGSQQRRAMPAGHRAKQPWASQLPAAPPTHPCHDWAPPGSLHGIQAPLLESSLRGV